MALQNEEIVTSFMLTNRMRFCLLSLLCTLLVAVCIFHVDLKKSSAKDIKSERAYEFHIFSVEFREELYEYVEAVIALILHSLVALNEPPGKNATADFSSKVVEFHSITDGEENDAVQSLLSADSEHLETFEGNLRNSTKRKHKKRKKSTEASKETENALIDNYNTNNPGESEANDVSSNEFMFENSFLPGVLVDKISSPDELAEIESAEDLGQRKSTASPSAAPTQEPTSRVLMESSFVKSGTIRVDYSPSNSWIQSLLKICLVTTFFVWCLSLCSTFSPGDNWQPNGIRSESTAWYIMVVIPVACFVCMKRSIQNTNTNMWYRVFGAERSVDATKKLCSRIREEVEVCGGYIESSREISGDLKSKRETVLVIRCPGEAFDRLIKSINVLLDQECFAAGLKKKVVCNTKFNKKDNSVQNRRLVALEQRQKYLKKFLERASTVVENLVVLKELNQTEDQIASITGLGVNEGIIEVTLSECTPNFASQWSDRSEPSYSLPPELSKHQVYGTSARDSQKCESFLACVDIECPEETLEDVRTVKEQWDIFPHSETSRRHNGYSIKLEKCAVDTRAVVRIGLYDKVEGRFCEQTSGFVANQDLGLIVTCSHLNFDPHTLMEKFSVPTYNDNSSCVLSCRYQIVIGVLEHERRPPKWKYTAEVVVRGDHDSKSSFVDALVLRVTEEIMFIPQVEGLVSSNETNSIFHSGKVVKCRTLAKASAASEKLFPAQFDMSSSSNVHVSDPVYMLGFPTYRAETICFDSSKVNQLVDKFIHCTAYNNSGSSGGPLIDRFGNVIAILSRSHDPGDIGVYLSSDFIAPLLRRAEGALK